MVLNHLYFCLVVTGLIFIIFALLMWVYFCVADPRRLPGPGGCAAQSPPGKHHCSPGAVHSWLPFLLKNCSQQSLKQTLLASQASPSRDREMHGCACKRCTFSAKKASREQVCFSKCMESQRLPELCHLGIILAEMEFFANSKGSIAINWK